MKNSTNVVVWLGHDGYRDPDDNVAMLLGSAQVSAVAASSGQVSLGGFVYGDTRDGAQYYMLHPTGQAPLSFGLDPRYLDKLGNTVAAGNYDFYQDYGRAALAEVAPGLARYDLLAQDAGGLRAWNFDATERWQISDAAGALAADIVQAIGRPDEVVVYSAGGGANVAAEAIGYLLNEGWNKAVLKEHFAIVQHGTTNWTSFYEPETRALTRDFTIAISDQNEKRYGNGDKGPDLKHALPAGAKAGDGFGDAFAEALAVATGQKAFAGLDWDATFRATLDASDAGSHAFAADLAALEKAWDRRMDGSDSLPDGDAWAHLIDTGKGIRERVIYDAFDRQEILKLLAGKKPNPVEPDPDPVKPGPKPDPKPDPEKPGPEKPGPVKPGPDPDTPDGVATLKLGGATLHGFAADGKAASVVAEDGRIGVAGGGSTVDVDRVGAASETLLFDFDEAAGGLSLRLTGVSQRDGASEGARLVVHSVGGGTETFVFSANGRAEVEFDRPASHATLEATDWIGGEVDGPDADVALAGLELDYLV
jgi:hypothetical protein